MKRKSFLLLALSAMTLTSCKGGVTFDSQVEVITFTGNGSYVSDYLQFRNYNVNLTVGQEKDLDITAIPNNYNENDIIVRSRDESIVTVEGTKVKGIGEGSTTLVVRTIDNKFSYTINVFVTNQIGLTEVPALVNKIYNNIQTTPLCNAVAQKESIDVRYETNGVLQRRKAYTEDIVIDEENAYFMVYSDDIEVKAENGSVEKTSGKWLFYTTDTYITYLFHEVGDAKRYCELNTKEYVGKARRVDAVYDILNMFFVAGDSIAKDIITDTRGDEDLKDTILDCVNKGYSNVTKNNHYTNGSDDLVSMISMNFTDQVFKQDSEDNGFIAGDRYDAKQDLEYFYNSNKMAGLNIDVVYDYKKNNQPCNYYFHRSELYVRNPVLDYPEKDPQKDGFIGYQKVDGLYDL